MRMRIESFTIDARDPEALAGWWAEALGWVVCCRSDDGAEVDLCERIDPDGGHTHPELSFVGDGDPDAGQERIQQPSRSNARGSSCSTKSRSQGSPQR